MVEVFNHRWPTSLKLDEEDWCEIYTKDNFNFSGTPKYFRRDCDGVSLSRLIMSKHLGKDKLKDKFIDHINHDPSDNRKQNLRLCNQSENMRNRKKKFNSKSKYKGVAPKRKYSSESRQTWEARIKTDVKHLYLGTFETEEAAALAYNEAAMKYYGEFAHLNEIVKE